jgi:phosphate transport system substrate-binding protein
MQRLRLFCIFLLAAACGVAQSSGSVIRNWGNEELASLLTRWQTAYRKTHPGIQFENKLMGPASAMAGIYTGVADLSWMSHEIRTEESMAFEWVYQYKALGIEVATASLNQYDHGAQLVVFVHRDNPLTKLSLAQLDGIFGSEHRHGGNNIRTWGDLGLSGEWMDRPIHPYGYDAETEAASFFRQSVLSGSYKWNCGLKSFRDEQRADGKIIDAAPQILEALSTDRDGIAYAKLRYATATAKALALAGDGSTYIAPSRETVQGRTYPITRAVSVYVNRDPAQPADPKIREFLRYVLSREGQKAIAEEGGYLPLTPEVAAAQLRKLD